jgi:hypothetical protein
MQFLRILNDIVPRYGAVFDSQAVTTFTDPYPKTDGIHYGPEEARAWANLVRANLKAFLQKGTGQGRKALPPTEIAYAETVFEIRKALPAKPPPGSEPVQARLRLVEKSQMPKFGEVTYRDAIGIYEYEVVGLREGDYPHRRLRLAHYVLANRKPTKATALKIGSQIEGRFVPIDQRPKIARTQTIDTLPLNLDLPVFVAE